MLALLPDLQSKPDTEDTLGTKASGCFSRGQRLLAAEDFKRVFAKACKAGNGQFTLLAIPNELGYARLGMAISRKAARLAVQRNRIKRQLREYFRLHHHELSAMDLVIMAKPGAATLDKKALQRSITHAFGQLARHCQRDKGTSLG